MSVAAMPAAPARPLPSNEEIAARFRAVLGGERVLSRLIELSAHAGDASIYRLVPRVVVLPETTDHVAAILTLCREMGLHLTFRAAGTSLSGQAVTDGVLVEVSRGWKGLRILSGGHHVAVEPGVIGAHVNAHLARYGAKMGPDPASINACMMGGIAANNSSGMCCGVRYNAYHTMRCMRFMLTDGTLYDTADADADEQLRGRHPEIAAGLLEIRRRIFEEPGLADRIRRKFSMKNTCGYSMNAFVDFERPIDILAHLLVGSEGTLGFIAEITLNTIPDKPLKATALVYFRELTDAGAAVHGLAESGAEVIEIMDRASMESVADDMQYGFAVEGNCAALLIEYQEESEEALAARVAQGHALLAQYRLLEPAEFVRDATRRDHFWHMRKGLFPSVGAIRQRGTAVIIEDVTVGTSRLAEAITDLQQMFVTYGYDDAIIFGHAKDGNLHFVICNDFSRQDDITRYAGLMDELVSIVVGKYDGALKAEHGTGRNVAPFVEAEWGPVLYGLMHETKALLDPEGLLSPGVLLNPNPRAHLEHLKVMPAVSPVVDKCIECGFCEPRCPSRHLTISPRQRIAVLRETERLKALRDPVALEEAEVLLREYGYDGEETCAGDSMCATACPVKIDTGAMIKDRRHAQHGALARRMAGLAASRFGWVAWAARMGLVGLQLGGPPARWMARPVAALLHRLSGGHLPRLPAGVPIPRPAPRLPARTAPPAVAPSDRTVVYYPSCLTRALGPLPGEVAPVGLAHAVVEVLERCGWTVQLVTGIENTCCGQPFYSKGFYEASAASAVRTVEYLYRATGGGKLPIVTDTSPCAGHLQAAEKLLSGPGLEKLRKLRVLDLPVFLASEVIPSRKAWPQVPRTVVLHPTCTTMKSGKTEALRTVASAFAERVVLPVHAECCGFAGDRGFIVPELTRSATRLEAREVLGAYPDHDQPLAVPEEGRDHYSTCRTCEIGLTAATSRNYRSLVYLALEALRQEGARRK